MRLRDIAYARSGDKGDVSNIGVIAKDADAYALLARVLIPERIKAHFGDWVRGEVEVYALPNIEAYNVVCRRALGGGATSTLRLDQTGKAMATALLRMSFDDLVEGEGERQRAAGGGSAGGPAPRRSGTRLPGAGERQRAAGGGSAGGPE